MSHLRIAFAGDRDISVWVLRFLIQQGEKPLALCVSSDERASHADELIALCGHLSDQFIFRGRQFRQPDSLEMLRALDLDYIIGIHFPYLIPAQVLSIPRVGVLNLHPAYLPYNRGWHTPSWAILDGTPYGATLHFMDAHVDTGDIVCRDRLDVMPGDTANMLYQRVKQLELQVFQTAWPQIVAGSYQRQQQDPAAGTTHQRHELLAENVQRIELDTVIEAGRLIQRLRALTTDRLEEAAYYELGGKRYRIQVVIHEEGNPKS